MNRFLLLFLLCASVQAAGQAPDMDAVLRVFTSRESSHVRREEEVLHTQIPRRASFLFDTLLPRLTNIHARKPDRMLYIHILRLQAGAASGYRNYDAARGLRPESVSLMKEAIRLCYLEGNDYLLAETYFDLAELYNAFWRYEEYLLMLTKAFELANRLGPESFPARLRYSKYGGMSKAAYRVYSFRECIRYGQQALRLRSQLPAGSDLMPDVYLLDLIGASYKQLQQPDSSSCYYRQLEKLLEKADRGTPDISFWKAIADGNIGENYLTKGDYHASFPLLKQWLQAARAMRDNLNICLAGNALAHWYDKQGDYAEARKHWREVYSTSFSLGSYEYAGKAAEGLAVIYRLQHQPDSAFFYYSRAHQYQDSVMAFVNRSGIQAIKARVELDNLQHSLENAGTLLRKERQNKWLLLTGIFLLAVIAALAYSRQRLKQKARLQETARLRREAETDARNARRQVGLFARHLQEKNTLIESLKDKIEAEHSLHSRQDVLDNLRSYTLVSDEEWEKFRADFTRAYPDFLPGLASRLPQITPAEERLSALLALGFTHPQVAGTLGIGKDSVTRAKHRLRLRLDLDKSESLEDCLHNILKADTSSKGAGNDI